MSYRRSPGEVTEKVGEGLRDPPAAARRPLAVCCEQSRGTHDHRRSPARPGR